MDYRPLIDQTRLDLQAAEMEFAFATGQEAVEQAIHAINAAKSKMARLYADARREELKCLQSASQK